MERKKISLNVVETILNPYEMLNVMAGSGIGGLYESCYGRDKSSCGGICDSINHGYSTVFGVCEMTYTPFGMPGEAVCLCIV